MARRRVCFYREGISCHGHRVLHSVAPERSANVAEFLESGALDQSPISALSKFANTISRTGGGQDSNAMQLSYGMHFSVRWKNVVVNTRRRKKEMGRTPLALLVAGSLLVALNVSSAPGQVPDGTVKITSRMVDPGIGLSCGERVLRYKDQDYPSPSRPLGFSETPTPRSRR